MIKHQQRIVLRLAMLLGGGTLPSLKREEGQALVEYALILALIAAVVATVIYTLGNKISTEFSSITSAI